MATLNAQALLDREGLAREMVDYRSGQTIFSQGDACRHVMYICRGTIKLSVRSESGREVSVAILGPGAFFGEACLAGQRNRGGSATAITRSTILRVNKQKMVRVLGRPGSMADQFIAHMLARHVRIERDLIDSLFNSCEKRLARTLLRLARYGQRGQPRRALPQLSLDALAEMADITRGTVNRFLKKFKKLGFIEGDGAFKVNSTLLRVVLRE